MTEGDLIVVPAGVEHMPVAEEECWIMMIENAGARNTGEAVTARTRTNLPELRIFTGGCPSRRARLRRRTIDPAAGAAPYVHPR